MDLSILELFVHVAKLGSFAEAARQQALDPSQVSRNIASLESHLKIQLFRRSTRKLALTEAGQRYLARIMPLLEEFQFANEEALELVQKPSGSLRVTASNAFGQVCLLPLLPNFMKTYPDIQIDLILSDENLDLYKDNIDVAFRLSPNFESNLIGIKLFDTAYHVCASPNYLKDNQKIRTPRDLSVHPCIAFSLPQFRSRWTYRNSVTGVEKQVLIQPSIMVNNALALRECLLMDMGIGLIAQWMTKVAIKDGSLIDLFPRTQFTATTFNTGAWLLYPSRQFLPTKTRIFIDYIKAHLSQSHS